MKSEESWNVVWNRFFGHLDDLHMMEIVVEEEAREICTWMFHVDAGFDHDEAKERHDRHQVNSYDSKIHFHDFHSHEWPPQLPPMLDQRSSASAL